MTAEYRARLHELYFGETSAAVRFQSWLLLFDIVLIGFFAAAPFIERDATFFLIDYFIATVLAIDLGLRAYAFGNIRLWATSKTSRFPARLKSDSRMLNHRGDLHHGPAGI
ncbi:MAG: hypothetical protein K2W91_06025, partial [Novosphingobium sp.]|nr:hypothetical protein [Novosphingobium sp.]